MSKVRERENDATEAAVDHAFPGWRETPIVPRVERFGDAKKEAAQEAALLAKIRPLYAAGWFERGGPIRTMRRWPSTRHVPGNAPTGGFDMCAGVEAAKDVDAIVSPAAHSAPAQMELPV